MSSRRGGQWGTAECEGNPGQGEAREECSYKKDEKGYCFERSFLNSFFRIQHSPKVALDFVRVEVVGPAMKWMTNHQSNQLSEPKRKSPSQLQAQQKQTATCHTATPSIP